MNSKLNSKQGKNSTRIPGKSFATVGFDVGAVATRGGEVKQGVGNKLMQKTATYKPMMIKYFKTVREPAKMK